MDLSNLVIDEVKVTTGNDGKVRTNNLTVLEGDANVVGVTIKMNVKKMKMQLMATAASVLIPDIALSSVTYAWYVQIQLLQLKRGQYLQ